MSKLAALRCCASCEWIYKMNPETPEPCPQCGFGSYGARYVHGNAAYRYAVSQKPWLDRKLDEERTRLHRIIRRSNKPNPLLNDYNDLTH